MKLISLAVVSFLAITVSAYPPNTDTHDMEQSQDAGTQNAQQPQSTAIQSTATQDMEQTEQSAFQTELDGLEEDHTKAQMLTSRIGSSISAMMRKRANLGIAMRKIKERFDRANASGPERIRLTRRYILKSTEYKNTCIDIENQQKEWTKAEKARDDIRAEIDALLATQE
ncbi:hypothetical protein BASA50_004391 [Batrachochytrium salamandrivorans]|uniref:Uncharacterized protein n=1 Tax=Batrachochytrium salamandrivorans TaxID=1357716 RepID=A0ABQ8FIH7_9FUNG|nr:hypothetical protein BASA62_004002 [Batrachochytrium salamandrivorans]KAH6585324.1 hypothetical protein BASA60_000613 [Batrachochytrium salamandrivorans]KAH6597474.1 hypothetical protein BASA50_004391 [Batrachochytrium salamandrivorans]